MNKQELIKKYKRLEGVWDAPGAETARQIFLQDLEQLDEPEKAKIPQFVADWYEEVKNDFDFKLWNAIYKDASGESSKISDWINVTNDALLTLVNMHQFGYIVDKEKHYMVKMKNALKMYSVLNLSERSKDWYFSNSDENPLYRTKFTRKELEEAGFGEVFNSPLFEVEEVE